VKIDKNTIKSDLITDFLIDDDFIQYVYHCSENNSVDLQLHDRLSSERHQAATQAAAIITGQNMTQQLSPIELTSLKERIMLSCNSAQMNA
jgi:hypothetical protein